MVEAASLMALAQLAIAVAGFSAIVVVVRRSERGRWRPGDGDRFNGMVGHALVAVVFSLLPSWVSIFVRQPQTVWAICSALLAVQILVHATAIFLAPSTPRGWFSTWFVVPAFVVVVLVGNALGRGFDRELAPYFLGVSFHVVQACILFQAFIWVAPSEAEKSRPKRSLAAAGERSERA